MHPTLVLTHSVFRYFVLFFLLAVIYRSFTGWQGKKVFGPTDNKLSLFLLISTHMQFVLGLVLYRVSPLVIFEGASMKNPVARYWLVEHISMMLIAVVLITVARSTAKRMSVDADKHKRLFILNTIALVVVVMAILMMKDRGFFTITSY